MRPPDFDVMILGQGLAGSALAWHLIRRRRHVLVIDDGHRQSASKVAAGLINPLAGMRFNARPELPDWLCGAGDWYEQLAVEFGRRFFHPLPMLRLFRSDQQRRFHRRRQADPNTRSLLGAAFGASDCPEPVAAPFGGFIQHHTGFVDLPALLASMRQWLLARGALREAGVDYRTLDTGRGLVTHDGLSARYLICCEGAAMRSNPWFRSLPLAPDKGEILDLEIDDWHPAHIVNGAHWLVPTRNGRVRFGATHEHQVLDAGTGKVARRELCEGFAALTAGRCKARLADQQAGIRPGTRDRYPFLGLHPDEPSIGICNGFGARGSLTIPWYTARLTAHLLDGAPLPTEADIRRFA